MFNQLDRLAPDPILGLIAEYSQDSNPQKIDLGAGVYKNAEGVTPIMQAIDSAQRLLLDQEQTKSYVGPAGCVGFNEAIVRLVLGQTHQAIDQGRVVSLQAPGGCGGLRVGAELIKRAQEDVTVWVSNPTWPNHVPLLSDAGLVLKQYPYYDRQTATLTFDAMCDALIKASPGDVVLLHACCHNPSGADLSFTQWQQLTELLLEHQLIPFIDIAYLGLGDGLDEDAAGFRYMTEAVSEAIIVNSCSKNFGLYRERVGSLIVIGETAEAAQAALSQAMSVARGIYSMPPNYGAALVDIVLNDASLKQSWELELASMRERMIGLRQGLVDALASHGRPEFAYIADQKGMFSFLGLSAEQVAVLKREHSIYMVDSSRISIAGLRQETLDQIAYAICQCL